MPNKCVRPSVRPAPNGIIKNSNTKKQQHKVFVFMVKFSKQKPIVVVAFVLPLDGQIYFQAFSLSLSLCLSIIHLYTFEPRHFCQFWLSIQATNLISMRAHNKQKTITSILTTKALCAYYCITWCKQYKMWHSLRVYCLHFIKSVSLSLAILIGWNI